MFCRLTEDEDPPFSFKNRQQMTQNITEFRVSLVSVAVANLSSPLYYNSVTAIRKSSATAEVSCVGGHYAVQGD